jgi:hypothetical protein
MKKGEQETNRLDNANSQLGVELWRIKSGLDVNGRIQVAKGRQDSAFLGAESKKK